ncbi:MAG: hypothetical protein M0003_18640 [Acidithiobacillus sp.]|nr:hypothetical protein [Acidithiobacillus sp.]
MDIHTIDQQYDQLQASSTQVSADMQVIADRLKTIAAKGNRDAVDLLQDLKKLASSIQSEQQQMFSLLQAIHDAARNEHQERCASHGADRPQASGFYHHMRGSGFAGAIERGIGFGIGDELIRRIL